MRAHSAGCSSGVGSVLTENGTKGDCVGERYGLAVGGARSLRSKGIQTGGAPLEGDRLSIRMAIRLETSKRTGIDNHQDHEISAFHLNWARRIGRDHPQARPRTDLSALYNCHGLTFASRRTRIEKSREVQRILEDDDYQEIAMPDVLPGDVVIYYSDGGDPNHSGIVVEVSPDLLAPIVCSKWGNADEFVHALRDCPNFYGPNHRFLR